MFAHVCKTVINYFYFQFLDSASRQTRTRIVHFVSIGQSIDSNTLTIDIAMICVKISADIISCINQ